MPRLSFVLPVYKPKPAVFEKCVEALCAQALDSWEAIFVLDGESKEAERIIKKHSKGHSIRVLTIPHSGAQAARNAGGKEANGEFVCFLDSDCVLEPGASKMWVEQFDKNPEVGFIYSGYKFFGEKHAIESEPWDPWTLRIRNYISGCFPMRKSLYPGWTEGLKSLQDWDMWLSLLEKATDLGWKPEKLGLYVRGYAFATAYPDSESISGQGCTPEAWLDRMDAVKKLHKLPYRDACVSSLQYRHDGIAFAKLIDADYLDYPNDKPHKYKTIIQVGFSLGRDCEKHSFIFQDKDVKKILFWTGDNINEIYNAVSFKSIDAISQLLNSSVKQYCEDLAAQRLLSRAGFKAEILPLPMGNTNILPSPKEKKWAVDIAGDYSPLISVIAQSLPDIQLDSVGPASRLSDYVGLLHFFPDRTMSASVKRALLTGRHVISNIQAPHCGFINDKWDVEKFIIETVNKIRETSNKPPDKDAAEYYASDAEKIKQAVLA